MGGPLSESEKGVSRGHSIPIVLEEGLNLQNKEQYSYECKIHAEGRKIS